ncbi:hypothetical protein BD309DRAFT_950041 [Dichomitus squalens]|nr:hypothetical protein BD309DRAFT_950041 [Dichomitus squalens]
MAGSGDPPGGSPSTNPTGNSSTTGNTSGPSTQPTSTSQPPDPVAAALNATAPQVSFSPDQLQAIVQTLATLYQGQQGAAAPAPPTATPAVVTAAAFPQFVFAPANPAPAGKSLLDLFPSIEGSVLLEIARHEFRPGDLYKLDPRHKDRATRQVLDVSSGVVSVRDQAPRDYPNFHSLYLPLITFFNVLGGFASTGGDAIALYQLTSSSSEYLARMVQFSQDYQWSAVLAYHFDFHYKRRREMLRGDYSGWATIDTSLQAEHLIGRERARPSGTPKGSAGGSSRPRDTEPCRNFNKGTCASPCHWNRPHKCLGCGATDHGQSACRRANPPAQA